MRPDFKEKAMGLGFIHFEFELSTKCQIEYMNMLLSGDKFWRCKLITVTGNDDAHGENLGSGSKDPALKNS